MDATGSANQLTGFAFNLGRALGVETYLGGAGGSGYTVNGSYQVFGNTARITPLATALPDYTLFFGSTNDRQSTPAAVAAAATAAFAAAKAAAPNTKLIVVTVPSVSGASVAADIANEAALATAATAAGAISVIRPIPEGWITGTGSSTGLTNDGNADVFNNGAMAGHLTQAGHDYFFRRIVQRLAADLSA